MYHIAQVNIARMMAPLIDPIMAGFVAQLDAVNAFADNSPGFIWRFQTSEGNATDVRAYDDELILFNMSVWASLNDLSNYVYASESIHRPVMKQRRQWFRRFDAHIWVSGGYPKNHIPPIEEAKERLEHLRMHGETSYAFSFKKPFPAPNATNEAPPQLLSDCLV